MGDIQESKSLTRESHGYPYWKESPQGTCLGPFIKIIYMNDIFYFIEMCDLTNYADDNTLDHIASTIETVLRPYKKYYKCHWMVWR